jgi:hypothetical protein
VTPGPLGAVAGLEFRYALYDLPPGRLPFRRFKWELWHGATLVASGWRVTRRDAGRALRAHAVRYGHGLFGLDGPPAEALAQLARDLEPGRSVRVDAGAISLRLVPRALEAAA